jgi:hypothetical protein
MSVSRSFSNFVVSNKGMYVSNCEPVRRNPCLEYKVYGLSETYELLTTKYSDHYELKICNLFKKPCENTKKYFISLPTK